MKAIYDVCAPAKLNLFLHVTGRRADGYHTLESAFMLIDWCDSLHFERRDDGQITREDLLPKPSDSRESPLALPAQDLTVRAAQALRRAAGSGFEHLGAHIGLLKSIPSQAGMGGGSSDAASSLLALNRLWNLNFPLTRLLEIGLALGADVPFFLHGRNAWITGIGEKNAALELPEARFLVVKPQDGLDTATIFSHAELTRNTATAIILGFAANPYGFGRNDLQAVAQSLCPGVGQSLELLEKLGLQGRMTGSGSAVFARLPGKLPDHALKQMPTGFWPTGFLVRECSNLDAHPLAGWAGS